MVVKSMRRVPSDISILAHSDVPRVINENTLLTVASTLPFSLLILIEPVDQFGAGLVNIPSTCTMIGCRPTPPTTLRIFRPYGVTTGFFYDMFETLKTSVHFGLTRDYAELS